MHYYCANSNFDKSDSIIVGIGYDGTSSFRPGSRFAPNAIREASYGLESYSPYLNKNLRSKRLCDMGNVPLPYGDKDLVLKIIERFTQKIIQKNKRLICLGGEHLISFPVIKNYFRKHKDLVVVQLDAHTDLMDAYRSEKLSHATVMRRVGELIGFENLYQLGIRSLLEYDLLLPHRDTCMCMYNLNKIDSYIEIIGKRHVYLSIDLDVFDPSILPGTGTPEPGGITYREFLDFIKKASALNIVGVDIVELAPCYDSSNVSAIVAAGVMREILLL